MSDYQNRRDIDRLYDDLYDYQNKTKVVVFSKDSPYRNISSKIVDGKENNGTIDAILEYYGLTTMPKDILNAVYPIGTLYHTTNDEFDPNNSFEGSWNKISEDDGIYVWERISETE